MRSSVWSEYISLDGVAAKYERDERG